MRYPFRILLAPFSIATLTLCAAGQGADDCASATLISGTGTFPVNTVGSTDSSQQSSNCPGAHNDVWFRWTATASQSVSLTTCAGTSVDTVIAVYAGSSCPAGAEMTCNDDYCGGQSRVFFSATAGTSYMIQIGAWSPGTTFTGTFSILPGSSNCNSGIGPDVIIGQIVGIQNAAVFGGLD